MCVWEEVVVMAIGRERVRGVDRSRSKGGREETTKATWAYIACTSSEAGED